MTLQIDYRPQTLDDVIGNKETVVSLKTNLLRKDPPHAMLFTGATGTGKTTLARIAARMLGCLQRDFCELNASDFRGIDTIRDICHQMKYKPIFSKNKAWLLDECHKLTLDAQEALLKALEDTPKHVYFLLATTNPEKLKPTLKRRCTPFELELLSIKTIGKYLNKVVHQEKKNVPVDVLKQIAQDSLGSLGIAMMILDKILYLNKEDMLQAAKRTAEQQNEVIELCRALMSKRNWKIVSNVLKGIQQEPESVRRAVLGYFTAVILNGDNPRAYLIMSCFQNNYFNAGKPGLVMSCYEAVST